MTREHLPPRSAGNDQALTVLDGEGTLIREFGEGHALRTLCGGCNKGASDRRLPLAYKLWHADVVEAIKTRTAAASVGSDLDRRSGSRSVEIDHSYALHPGRIARQVLGMLLAVQAGPSLTEAHPQLREAYFSEGDGQSIGPLTLHLTLADTGFGYLKNVLTAYVRDPRTKTVQATDIRLWSFPPLLPFSSMARRQDCRLFESTTGWLTPRATTSTSETATSATRSLTAATCSSRRCSS